MRLILLSGGSGKRLWPLSNDSRSKQFLKVLRNKDGIAESMIQRVWSQIKEAGLHESSIIATNKSQHAIIQNHLDERVSIVVEPERRDTFPAIALSASYFYSVEKADPDEILVVLPVDPYVENKFFYTLKEMEDNLKQTAADLVLMGVKPTYPSEKYGYIIPEKKYSQQEDKSYSKVSYFKEKPEEKLAEQLIAEGALWNCGVFAFRLKYIISILEQMDFPLEYQSLLNEYARLPKISFDYQVVEKAKDIHVIPYDGYWRDLGTWNTLTDEMASPLIGKGIICKDSINTHVINELDIPVAVLGLSNIVVAVSPDGILVSDKLASPKVKELVKEFDNRLMYEERRWGWYRVLDFSKYEDGREILTRRIHLKEGKSLSYQLHNKRSEVWTIINGHGEIIIEGELKELKSGDIVNIPSGYKHALRALADMEFIEVQNGIELSEDDIMRYPLEWSNTSSLISN
jgi:mannose-1-phosphate guanylyltransferase